jgi:O-methyltransferase
MTGIFSSLVRPILHKCGIDIVRHHKIYIPPDFTEQHAKIYRYVEPFTTTGSERVYALIEAVKYVVANKIEGSFVECGVWKGGSIMAMALTLQALGDTTRDIYLYDTFTGMTAPSNLDVNLHGRKADEWFSEKKTSEDSSAWCLCPLDQVKEDVFKTGYPKERFHFIEGKVEDTIPKKLPGDIAFLRLDTDWYGSTKHELQYLFPLVKPYGVMLIDDYGHWQGQRKAVDEFILENRLGILLNRIDYSARLAIKVPNGRSETSIPKVDAVRMEG